MSPGPQFIPFNNFWIESGETPVIEPANYILTESIKSNLASLARILVSRKYPILLQVCALLPKKTSFLLIFIRVLRPVERQVWLNTLLSVLATGK